MTARHASISMKTLQAADHVLGFAACALLQPLRVVRRVRTHVRVRPPTGRVLLIKFWGVGSLQLLTPAARVLRDSETRSLTLLTLEENAAFARGLGLFDEVLTLDVRRAGWLRIFVRIGRLVRLLRRRRFDGVYDFEFFTRFSAVIATLCRARQRHGFRAPKVWRGGLHSHTVPFNRYWHVARNFRALAGAENGSEVGPEDLVPYTPTDAEESRARALLADAPEAECGPLIVLNPNAGRLSLERRWPPERFAALAVKLAQERAATVVFSGSPAEAEYTAEAARLARERVDDPRLASRLANLAGRLSIGELCALLARADAVISNDSGPMHLAAALGTPTVGLFGPETPVMYRPIGARVRALWRPPICSPCINVHDNKRATCIHGQPECLMNIDLFGVFEATASLLDGPRLRPLAPPDLSGFELERTDAAPRLA